MKNSIKEATKRGKNGGIKSGEARRKKKTEKDYLKVILALPITNDDIKEELSSMGIQEEYFNNEMLLTYNLFKLALDGDLNAIKYIDERMGKNPQLELKRQSVMGVFNINLDRDNCEYAEDGDR